MDAAIEKKFEALAQDITGRASSVKCSIPDYVEGLKMIREEINTALECAEADLRRENKG